MTAPDSEKEKEGMATISKAPEAPVKPDAKGNTPKGYVPKPHPDLPAHAGNYAGKPCGIGKCKSAPEVGYQVAGKKFVVRCSRHHRERIGGVLAGPFRISR